MNNTKLDEAVNICETARRLINLDMFFCVFDKDGRVYYKYPDTDDPSVKIGQIYNDPTGALDEVLRTGKPCFNRIDKSAHDFDIEGNLLPIKDGDEVVGVIGSSYIPVDEFTLAAQQVALKKIFLTIYAINPTANTITELFRSYGQKDYPVNNRTYSSSIHSSCEYYVHPDDKVKFLEFADANTLDERLKNRDSISLELRWKKNDNNYIWIEYEFVKLEDASQASLAYICLVRNIHEKKLIQERSEIERNLLIAELQHKNQSLSKRELFDELTDVYNRRALSRYASLILETSKREKECFYILLADLDNLKYINDNFGHDAGDFAIKSVAKLLKDSMPKGSICIRYGGDEFLVINQFPVGSTEPEKFILKFREKLSRLAQTSIHPYRISASYGAFFDIPEQDATITDCIRLADAEMYSMKQLHRFQSKSTDDLSVSPLSGITNERPTVFILDPLKSVRSTLKKLLSKNFNILEAASVEEMKSLVINPNNLVLVIGDIITVLSREYKDAIKEMEKLADPIPPLVLILRGEDDFLEKRAIEIGTTDFIYRPFNLPIVKNRLTNIINAFMSKNYLDNLKEQQNNIENKDTL
ncbi:MAG: diguanylate cyclase [Parasporobacterium sp.]|nr:diguanylate cyclase [Parasporobacterium sp.]